MVAKLIALIIPLGLDTFAVAAAIGMIGATPRRKRQITVLFTGFETGMPLAGLAIGFTLGLLRLPTVLVIALIAVQTMIVTQLGLRRGSRLGQRTREGAERLAGIALTGLGIVLLAEQLLA